MNSHPSAVSRRERTTGCGYLQPDQTADNNTERAGGEENIVILLHEAIISFSPGECEWISIQSERGCL
ncbi:hypothetical protein CesoFtcFv8_023536 [Champsocephalus esox]|uniref:Uncharacterized protein n=1 Tax=Champsocephalus esox TaxID=159716 RepID=A0AAN8B9P7_9TELE|nr:hypothetical protein CesoFtcFv8_023536 [Champsocephalus esox]